MGQKARVELVLDCAEPKRLATFWREALDYRDYCTDSKLAVLVPKEGIASPLLLQCVPEPKAGKNRMHLDIVVDDIGPEVHRLQELGAHRIDEGVQSFGGTQWVGMSDPEQNEFCVSTGVDGRGLMLRGPPIVQALIGLYVDAQPSSARTCPRSRATYLETLSCLAGPAFWGRWDKREAQASATLLMAANVAPIPFFAASLRMPTSSAASSPNIFSKKAKPSGGSSHVSVTSVPPSTETNE
jgi:hypothetical protein